MDSSCVTKSQEESLPDSPEPYTISSSATPISKSNPWTQVKDEHCYPKLMAQWVSLDQPLLTCHVFDCYNTAADSDSGVESTDEEALKEGSGCADEDELVDVVHVTPPPSLPYNERKVMNVMYECAHHMNLVRLPLENHDGLLERVLMDGDYCQQLLLKKALDILQAEHLARLAFVGLPDEPIQRRLSCDKAGRKMRKLLGEVKWDPKLTHWLHKTFLKALDNTYLPVYLDLLQVLMALCPSLVEVMLHGTNPMGDGSNEAVSLLLKRPWSVLSGMSPMDKRVNFTVAPIFVTVPHSSCPLGGRRWKLWQTQLSSIGKIFPVIPPDYIREAGQNMSQEEAVEILFHCALTRIQEIAEVEKIHCLVCLGLTTRGLDFSWKICSDPFSNCTTPCIFVIGDRGLTSSCSYVEDLRSGISSPTGLILIHGADDLLRLPFDLKRELNITQSMLDRLIQDHIYEFLVYILPCSFPSDTRHTRKRKSGMEDQSNSHLSPATSNSPIILTSHPSLEETINPAVLKGLLNNGKMTVGSLGSKSGIRGMSSQISVDFPASKLPKIGRPPKNPRPRSKSTTTGGSVEQKKSNLLRNRSLSSEVSLNPLSSPTCSNTNQNNSNEASPNTLLAITQMQASIPSLLPVTPPKNPYEDPNQILNSKIRKQLNL